MKIHCECGGVISDNTDYLSFDFLETIDSAIEKSYDLTNKDKKQAVMNVRTLALKLTKTVYQCRTCGRLFIDNEINELEIFIPSEPGQSKNILGSALGENWQQRLIVYWDANKQGQIS